LTAIRYRQPDGRKDGQTDIFSVAIPRFEVRASRRRNSTNRQSVIQPIKK